MICVDQANHSSMRNRASAFVLSGEPLARIEQRAMCARVVSSRPKLSRPSSYSASKPEPKNNGSSAFRVTGTLAARSLGSG